MKPTDTSILSTDYDPAKHALPTAYGRVEAGDLVAAAVGGLALVMVRGWVGVGSAPYDLMVMEREEIRNGT